MAELNKIFKDGKIKGQFSEEINEELAEKIGRATVCFLNCKKVAVGKRGEKEAGKIANAIIEGLISQGANVKKMSETDTVALYKEMGISGADAGILVSAEQSVITIEILKKDAEPLDEENGLKEIRVLAEKGLFTECEEKGTVE
ncbi:MAG: hypothetical protein QGI60_01725 [archaeon]|jgi:phosphomannomutase|nr:hypothetical protein [archaeon]